MSSISDIDQVQLYQTRGQENVEVVVKGIRFVAEQNSQILEKIEDLPADLANKLMQLLDRRDGILHFFLFSKQAN